MGVGSEIMLHATWHHVPEHTAPWVTDSIAADECGRVRLHTIRTPQICDELSKSYGIEFTAPEGLVEMIGKYFLLDMSDYEKAIEFFVFNTGNYPNSAEAYAYLGRAYSASGNGKMAIESLRKASQLDSEDGDLLILLEQVSGEKLAFAGVTPVQVGQVSGTKGRDGG